MGIQHGNLARMDTATTGTGTVTLGSAVTGHQSFAAAGITDGSTVYYVINDGVDWEIGVGVYTAAGTTMTRTPVESTNSDAAITLTGNAEVALVVPAAIVAVMARSDLTQAWTKPQSMDAESVSYAASITPDLSAAPWKAIGDLTGALTLNLPINCAVRDHFILYVPQDSTGSRVVTENAGYLNDITWSTTADFVDIISCVVLAVSGTTATKVAMTPIYQGIQP